MTISPRTLSTLTGLNHEGSRPGNDAIKSEVQKLLKEANTGFIAVGYKAGDLVYDRGRTWGNWHATSGHRRTCSPSTVPSFEADLVEDVIQRQIYFLVHVQGSPDCVLKAAAICYEGRPKRFSKGGHGLVFAARRRSDPHDRPDLFRQTSPDSLRISRYS